MYYILGHSYTAIVMSAVIGISRSIQYANIHRHNELFRGTVCSDTGRKSTNLRMEYQMPIATRCGFINDKALQTRTQKHRLVYVILFTAELWHRYDSIINRHKTCITEYCKMIVLLYITLYNRNIKVGMNKITSSWAIFAMLEWVICFICHSSSIYVTPVHMR